MGTSAPHLLPANATHVKNCTNQMIAGSGNGAMNSVGVGNRMPQGNPQTDFVNRLKYAQIT